ATSLFRDGGFTLTNLLTLLLLASFISHSWSVPKGSFQRRNWTPQAMLYLKGTQGRRFISEDGKEGDVYDTLHLVPTVCPRPEIRTRQNTEKLSVGQAATVLLKILQQAREGGDHSVCPLVFWHCSISYSLFSRTGRGFFMVLCLKFYNIMFVSFFLS
uniref:Spexin hormone n=1 Tax=Poecilia reticulata TaxID=8081 RepID=A0A3P9P7Z2_POERE